MTQFGHAPRDVSMLLHELSDHEKRSSDFSVGEKLGQLKSSRAGALGRHGFAWSNRRTLGKPSWQVSRTLLSLRSETSAASAPWYNRFPNGKARSRSSECSMPSGPITLVVNLPRSPAARVLSHIGYYLSERRWRMRKRIRLPDGGRWWQIGADGGLLQVFREARQKCGGRSGCNQREYRPNLATSGVPALPGNGPAERRFSSGAVRVLPCAALRPVSLLFLVALTGIEPVFKP